MQLITRLNKYFKSFFYSSCINDHPTVLMGHQGQDLIDFFKIDKDNYICSSNKRPINFNILLQGIIFFVKTALFNPKVFRKTLRWFHTIYFICAYLKLKKIKCLISFTDYNPLPMYIRQILDTEIKTIGIQNSRRENRSDYSNFDFYLLLLPLRKSEKKILKNCIMQEFGSLRLLLSISKKNKWKEIIEFPSNNINLNELTLISSLTADFLRFIKMNFEPNNSLIKFKKKLNDLKEQFQNKENQFRELRFLNFLILCDFISDYAQKKNDKVTILNRSETKTVNFVEEERFYKIFPNFELKHLTKVEKYDYILTKKDRIFASDISTLSRECLSINTKCIFFNNHIEYTGKYWTNNDSIFYSNKESKEDFHSRLEKIQQLNDKGFSHEKKKIKDESIIISPSVTKLEEFLNMSNLELRKS